MFACCLPSRESVKRFFHRYRLVFALNIQPALPPPPPPSPGLALNKMTVRSVRERQSRD